LRLAWYGADARALAVEARGPAPTFGRATDVNFSAHPVISQDLCNGVLSNFFQGGPINGGRNRGSHRRLAGTAEARRAVADKAAEV